MTMELSDADLETLLEIIQEADDTISSQMLFGHNNGFSQLANYLCDSFTEIIPTAGVVCLDFDLKKWEDVKRDSGKLMFTDFNSITAL